MYRVSSLQKKQNLACPVKSQWKYSKGILIFQIRDKLSPNPFWQFYIWETKHKCHVNKSKSYLAIIFTRGFKGKSLYHSLGHDKFSIVFIKVFVPCQTMEEKSHIWDSTSFLVLFCHLPGGKKRYKFIHFFLLHT